jgi:iron complex transport system substrate-binding protein
LKRAALAAMLTCLLVAATATAAPAPRRIVSLNMCMDAVLVELVPHERIAAITHYSRDPWRSTIAAVAQKLPITYQTAEEVVALKPDLVVAAGHSSLATRNALQRVGIRFQRFDVPTSVAGSIEQIRKLAALLQQEERGEQLVARIERAVAAARVPPGAPILTAAVYQPGGLTAGANTVTGELMEIVGLDNLPARFGIEQHRPLRLEQLLLTPPDILLVGATSSGAATRAERIVHHRALRVLEQRMQRDLFEVRLLYCSGPAMIGALDTLVAARAHALQKLARVDRP